MLADDASSSPPVALVTHDLGSSGTDTVANRGRFARVALRSTMEDQSYTSGTSECAAARAHDRRRPPRHGRPLRRPRGAGRLPERPAVDLRRARRRRRPARPRAARRRASRRATGSGSGRRTAPSGCCCSTPPPRSGRSSSTSTRRTGPTSWRTCCDQSGVRLLVAATDVQDERLPGDGGRGAPASARARAHRSSSARRSWDELVARPATASRRARSTSGWRRCRSTTRSTSSTRRARPGSPRARRCRTTTSSTTATSSAS